MILRMGLAPSSGHVCGVVMGAVYRVAAAPHKGRQIALRSPLSCAAILAIEGAMDAGLEGTRRDWVIAALAMAMIGVVVAVILHVSPGPVEAHIAGLVPRAAAVDD